LSAIASLILIQTAFQDFRPRELDAAQTLGLDVELAREESRRNRYSE
jgi:hypothetical protein